LARRLGAADGADPTGTFAAIQAVLRFTNSAGEQRRSILASRSSNGTVWGGCFYGHSDPPGRSPSIAATIFNKHIYKKWNALQIVAESGRIAVTREERCRMKDFTPQRVERDRTVPIGGRTAPYRLACWELAR
jgi:hypothetical protein